MCESAQTPVKAEATKQQLLRCVFVSPAQAPLSHWGGNSNMMQICAATLQSSDRWSLCRFSSLQCVWTLKVYDSVWLREASHKLQSPKHLSFHLYQSKKQHTITLTLTFVNMSQQGMQERGRESGGGMFIKTKSYTQRKGKIKTARAGWWTIVTWSLKRCLWMFYSQDISTPETSQRAWPC